MSQRDLIDFINDFNELLIIDNLHAHGILPPGIFIDGKRFSIKEAKELVSGIWEGKIKEISKLKVYLKYVLDYFESHIRRNLHDYEDLDDDERDEYDSKIKSRRIINRLLDDLNKPASTFGIMNVDEIMALKSLERQGIKRKPIQTLEGVTPALEGPAVEKPERRMTLPPEMFREIGEFVGNVPKGGMKRSKSNKNKTKRGKGKKTRKIRKTRKGKNQKKKS